MRARGVVERLDAGTGSGTLDRLLAESDKAGTPTMGGLVIVSVVDLVAVLLCQITEPLVLVALFAMNSMCVVGGIDDLAKLRGETGVSALRRPSRGLPALEKLGLQVIVSLATLVLMVAMLPVGTPIPSIPEIGGGSVLVALVPIALMHVGFFVGTTNAVNLADGLDGLAAGCALIVCSVLGVATYVVGDAALGGQFARPFVPGAHELTVLVGALGGALAGFLLSNITPARMFMGDAGSQSIGAALAVIALCSAEPVVLVIAGAVFVIEIASVVLQVSWFRVTGRRLIPCAPFHYTLLFRGWTEMSIVLLAWAVSAGAAVLSLLWLGVL